jgi:hypothetical protein
MRSALILAAFGMIALAGVGCQHNKDKDMNGATTRSSMNMSTDACPMCPGVQKATADGKCPVCGMKVTAAH